MTLKERLEASVAIGSATNGAEIERILLRFNADVWDDAAKGAEMAIAIANAGGLTAEQALRHLAKMFRGLAQGSRPS